MRRQLGDGATAKRPGLCTIGFVAHDPATNGAQDLETYQSLSSQLGNVYAIGKSPVVRDLMIRSGNVVVLALAVRPGLLVGRIQFITRTVRIGLRLNRKGRISVYAASDPLISGTAGLILRLLTGRPLLVHLQGQLLDLPREEVSRFRRSVTAFVSRAVCRRADMVRCVSKALMEQAEKAGVSREALVYLPSRVDTDRFSPSRRGPLAPMAREEIGRATGRTIMYAGTLSHTKGVHLLVEALPEVLMQYPDVTLILVGSGPSELPLRRLTRDVGVEDRVVFVGRTSHAEMPKYLSLADVVVLPSLNEGLPRILLEALASGLPVVATSVGGIPEVVNDGRTGLLVPPANRKALSDAIGRVLGSRELADALGRAGRELMELHYEREPNIRKYADLVRNVASAGRRRGRL